MGKDKIDRQRVHERLLRLAFQDTEQPVMVLAPGDKVFAWTRGMADLLGHAPEDILGKSVEGIVPASRRPALRALLAASRGQTLLRHAEMDLLHRDNFTIPARLTLYDLTGAGEDGACVVLWIQPSTAAAGDELKDPILRETVIRLQQLSAIGQLTAALAHQIRTPLHVIQSTVEFIQEELPADSPRHESLRVVNRNVERIKALSDALAGFTRYKKHAIAPGDLNKVVEQVCLFMEMLCKKQGVKLAKTLAPLPPVQMDADYLLGALYNIMANAVDAMPEGGVLAVTTAVKGDGVVLSVADTGSGMDAAVLAQIGRPFFTTKSFGTGLGLYVVGRILDQHEAKLKVESKKGGGTKMHVTFPGAKSR